MATYTQTHHLLTVNTPLGPDVLLATGFTGHEAVSELFNFRINVQAQLGTEVSFDKLLGQTVALTLQLADGSHRYFNGLCSGITQGESDREFTRYELEVVPRLWLLTKTAQSRTFQHLGVPDILKKVFAGLNVAYKLQGTFQPRDYCVQYRESDFAFASRLMEEEGIFYFFGHHEGGHQLILANTPYGHPELPGGRVLYEEVGGGHRPQDRVHEWTKRQVLATGKFTLWDHSFELPHKHLEATRPITDGVAVGSTRLKLQTGHNDLLEVYDYPGAYSQRFDGVDRSGGEQPAEVSKIYQDNQRTVDIRAQAEAAASLVLQGAGNCRRFTSGYFFTLETVDRDREGDVRADGAYVLTAVTHEATVTADYRSNSPGHIDYKNRFTCLPHALPFRPRRVTPRPTVRGSQTAVVVGPAGEEIFTDKYGRVKVQFHWDREGKNDADSSCWVRVGTIWAGKRWGVVHIPRVGQEVIVDFLEGDPDQPIIIGSVYNADQMPPYLGKGLDAKHPHDPKISGIKTNSTPGGAGFNEIRFDDTKGKEQVFLHAERNQDVRVKNDCMETVLHDRHMIVGAGLQGDLREEIHGDKHVHVHRMHMERITGNMLLTVGSPLLSGLPGAELLSGNQDIVVKHTLKERVEGDDHRHVKGASTQQTDGELSATFGADHKEKVAANSHLHVGKDRVEKVDGGLSLTVGGDRHEKVGALHAVEAGKEIHLKAGTQIVIESGQLLTLKGPGGYITIGPDGISIEGILVRINAGGTMATGSGSKPQTPVEPAQVAEAFEAIPFPPTPADDSVPGSGSAPQGPLDLVQQVLNIVEGGLT